MSKTKRFRSSTNSQTRKRTVQSPVKKTIVLSTKYKATDQESEIPISSYQPQTLPTATAGGLSEASMPNGGNMSDDIICYKVTQTETKDTFIAKVKTSVGINGIEILVGGSIQSLPKECVKINIHTIHISDTEIIIEAVFIVDYNERCNIAKNPKSAVMLARVAISFAYTYFKIDKFTLRDQSVFHCKTSNKDYEFSLAGRELLKHGQTWYQRHLNAHIYHPRTLEDIQRYIAFVNTKPPWSAFVNTKHAERLKVVWDKSASYKELVLTLLDDIHRVNPDSKVDEYTNLNCNLLHPWFNTITYEYLKDFPVVDNFILRDGFQFVEGLKVEVIPENEYASFRSLQIGGVNLNSIDGRIGWNDPGHWFTERIR